jgi:putative solute:sodium symporter small subunit|tara:strand:+ start:249 stop:509 length:261 start_codon:yes stop_codon:yes gene_type:complete
MKDQNSYWEQNVKLILKCLFIWFIVSYGFSIVFVDILNQIRIGGYKLGFWFSQQGSIYTFVFLIFYYAKEIEKIDIEFASDKSSKL